MKEEIWKVYTIQHPGFPGQYPPVIWEVSDQGNVKKNGVLYTPKLKNRYLRFSKFSVHRAVAELFISNPENKPFVDHINGNKLDNKATNLRWCTTKENANNINTKSYGEKNGFYNKHHNKDTRKQLSKQQTGRKMMCNGTHRTYVKPDDFNDYLMKGYHFGMK